MATQFTKEQMAWMATGFFTPYQLRELTPDQLRTIELLKNAPKIERLYSGILADIRASRRRLDQKTFGPGEGVEGPNLCNTPMCIAGHTVNRAGAAGIELKQRFGFANAAMAIHLASRPDAPGPRYDSYPNEWALAFIEARAAEEEAQA